MTIPETQLQTIVSQVVKIETLQEVSNKAINDMAGNIGRLVDRLEKSDDVAKEAAQSARSAHHRIAELREELKDESKKLKDELDGTKQNQRWLVTTSCTLISLGIAALGFAFKFVQ